MLLNLRCKDTGVPGPAINFLENKYLLIRKSAKGLRRYF